MEIKHKTNESVCLLWYYGVPNLLGHEVERAINRFREKYGLEPTRAWFRTGVDVNAEDVHGLEIGYKDHVLPGHFEVSAEEE